MISDLRESFNLRFRPDDYLTLLRRLDRDIGAHVEFRVAETPVFLPQSLLNEIADAGARLARRLLAAPEYLASARQAVPRGFLAAGESAHPHFLTADFALIQETPETRAPRLVEIQAFPSVFAYQALLSREFAQVFQLPDSLGTFLGGLSEDGFWTLLRQTVVGNHSPEHVVLTEVDPMHQKTLPDFLLTARRLGIAIVDIATLEPRGRKLHYRAENGRLIPIHRIYNRAIADEIIGRGIHLPFDLTQPWDVEWAGHPNWYFLISKYSIPWLFSAGEKVVPPAVFLNDFLGGEGYSRLEAAGVRLGSSGDPDAIFEDLLLKPLFSFAGKGIQFAPSRAELAAIPAEERGNYLLQQRMHFVPTIQTPFGPTQAEIRILYLWPDGGELTPAIPLVRLGRGKMMGVDHNRNQEWVGASAAFWR